MQKKSIAVNYILNTTYQILILIVPLITTPYISRVLGAEGIGVYSYTYSVVSYFLIVAAMGTTTYGQRTIAYYQDDKYKRSCKFFEILLFRALTTGVCSIGYIWYIQQSYQFVWIIGIPIMMGVMAIADTFVPVFYGSGYDKIKILLPIYSLSVIPVALSNVTGCQFLIPTKKQNVYSAAVLSSTVVNITLNSFLIPRFLSYGAASASVIAECVGCIIMIVYVEVKHLVDAQDNVRGHSHTPSTLSVCPAGD